MITLIQYKQRKRKRGKDFKLLAIICSSKPKHKSVKLLGFSLCSTFLLLMSRRLLIYGNPLEFLFAIKGPGRKANLRGCECVVKKCDDR